MVTKGKILEIISDKEVKIEVPAFGLIEEMEGESEVNEMPVARICTVPGCLPNFAVGDVILICIEDNDLSAPMIMGRLIPDDESLGTSNATFQTLAVEKDTTLSKDTTIGDVTPENISYLEGVTSHIQAQFDTNTTQKINALNDLSKLFKDAVSNMVG